MECDLSDHLTWSVRIIHHVDFESLVDVRTVDAAAVTRTITGKQR
ncbi:hypothetical protein Pla52n_68690 [Stieleria varia]|uniref:Uncharacterized protein n=1 Tax=Stieleria varia TaxID=2528005 RepID=A0A5C5ZQ73_9BACT|nr:hypothetical protein Pla52n_68690 [Stieleria varia]